MTDLVEAGFKPREKRYDLEMIEGGWVKLRRMSHGSANELTDVRLSFESGKGKGQAKARLSTVTGRQFQFEKAVVDHNLGDNGRKYNFSKPEDVDALDPSIGDEIAQLIDDHQDLVEDDDIPNSEASLESST